MQPADLSTRLVNLNENTATCARPFPPLLLWLPLSPSFPLFPLLSSLFSPSLLPFLCFFANLQSCNHFDLIKCSLNFHRVRLNWILCPKLRSLQACYLATCPIVAPQILHLILMHMHKYMCITVCLCVCCKWISCGTLNLLAIFSMRKTGANFAVTRGQFLRCPLSHSPSPGELMTVISAREYLRIARLLQICVTFAWLIVLALNLLV